MGMPAPPTILGEPKAEEVDVVPKADSPSAAKDKVVAIAKVRRVLFRLTVLKLADISVIPLME